MPTIELDAKLADLPSELVGRFVKTQLALCQGYTLDPPLLDGADIVRLKAVGLLPTGEFLFGFMLESDALTGRELVSMWNGLGEPFPRAVAMTSDRAAKIKTRLREIPNREDWKTILSRVKESPWHRGENDRGWIATFDWLIKNASTPIRILERSICRMDACGNEIGNGQSEAEPNLSRL